MNTDLPEAEYLDREGVQKKAVLKYDDRTVGFRESGIAGDEVTVLTRYDDEGQDKVMHYTGCFDDAVETVYFAHPDDMENVAIEEGEMPRERDFIEEAHDIYVDPTTFYEEVRNCIGVSEFNMYLRRNDVTSIEEMEDGLTDDEGYVEPDLFEGFKERLSENFLGIIEEKEPGRIRFNEEILQKAGKAAQQYREDLKEAFNTQSEGRDKRNLHHIGI